MDVEIEGLREAIEVLTELETQIQEKIGLLFLKQDRRRDEYYNTAVEIVEDARCRLEEIDSLKLEDF